jgi:hypothetical protein
MKNMGYIFILLTHKSFRSAYFEKSRDCRCDCRQGKYQGTRGGCRYVLPVLSVYFISKANSLAQVGPGTGVLTRRILQKAKSCVAIELDARMAAELTKMVQGTPHQRKLKIILGDFIKGEIP